jgi:hypothetical protein
MATTSGVQVLPIAPGFNNVLSITVTTAQASIGTGDIAFIYQIIEGYRISRLAWGTVGAQHPITIGFWTAHARTGTYSVAVRNALANRSYVANYTQNVANTGEYKTVTVPADTTGTWPTDNTAGMQLSFTMACGSSLVAPVLNAWQAGNYVAGAGHVNGVAATSDVFRITGVVVLPGIEAPSAAQSPLIMRPFDQELVTCQRYWEKSYSYDIPIGTVFPTSAAGIQQFDYGTVSSQQGGGTITFSVRKRGIPTITTYDDAGAAGKITATPGNGQTPSLDMHGMRSFHMTTQAASGACTYIRFHWTADARL